jgi:hypothetical protein
LVNWWYIYRKKAVVKHNNWPATAYFKSENQYVVVDDYTNEIIQVSNLENQAREIDQSIYWNPF